LDGKRKCKDEEFIAEDGEPKLKKANVAASKPSGSKLTVEISAGMSRAVASQPISETVELLQELVSGIRDLSKVTRGLTRLGYRMYQQNTKLIRLRKRQAYLAEQARGDLGSGLGSGSVSEAGSGSGSDGGGK
jgi:hypothetical protein